LTPQGLDEVFTAAAMALHKVQLNLTFRVTGVKAMDSNGLSDPFIRFLYGEKLDQDLGHKTEMIKKTLNPEFAYALPTG